MSKLIEIEDMAFDLCRIDNCKHLPQSECDKTTCAHCEAEALYNAGYRKIGDKVIELSCKVGDVVYEKYRGRVIEYVVHSIEIHSAFDIYYKIHPIGFWDRLIRIIGFTEDKIGKTIFLTREEAENAREQAD